MRPWPEEALRHREAALRTHGEAASVWVYLEAGSDSTFHETGEKEKSQAQGKGQRCMACGGVGLDPKSADSCFMSQESLGADRPTSLEVRVGTQKDVI